MGDISGERCRFCGLKIKQGSDGKWRHIAITFGCANPWPASPSPAQRAPEPIVLNQGTASNYTDVFAQREEASRETQPTYKCRVPECTPQTYCHECVTHLREGSGHQSYCSRAPGPSLPTEPQNEDQVKFLKNMACDFEEELTKAEARIKELESALPTEAPRVEDAAKQWLSIVREANVKMTSLGVPWIPSSGDRCEIEGLAERLKAMRKMEIDRIRAAAPRHRDPEKTQEINR